MLLREGYTFDAGRILCVRFYFVSHFLTLLPYFIYFILCFMCGVVPNLSNLIYNHDLILPTKAKQLPPLLFSHSHPQTLTDPRNTSPHHLYDSHLNPPAATQPHAHCGARFFGEE
jgi:hypothetical protein